MLYKRELLGVLFTTSFDVVPALFPDRPQLRLPEFMISLLSVGCLSRRCYDAKTELLAGLLKSGASQLPQGCLAEASSKLIAPLVRRLGPVVSGLLRRS